MTTLAAHEMTNVPRSVRRNPAADAFMQDAASAAASVPADALLTIRVSHYMRNKRAEYYAAVLREAKASPTRANKESSGPLLRSLVASAGLLMPLDASDELTMTAADTVPQVAPLAHAQPVANIEETSDDVDSRPWRGVLAVKHVKKILFRKRIDIRPGKLRAWTPDPINARTRRSEDDE